MFKNHNEQGSALLLTIIITMILLVLGGALASFSLMERGQVGRDEADLKAYYIARSGADLMAQAIIEKPEEYDTVKGQTSNEVHFNEGYFTAKAEDHPSGVRVSSTGVVGNRKRTVSIILEKENAAPGFEHAVYSKTGILINAGANIEGDIATSRTDLPAVSLKGGVKVVPKYEDGAMIQPGDVYIPSVVYKDYPDNQAVFFENPSTTISGEVKPKDLPDYGGIEFKDPPVAFESSENEYFISTAGGTETRTLVLEESVTHYKKFGAEGSNKTMVIDLGNEDRTLVIDQFVQNSAKILLKNPGHLYLFVKDMVCSAGASLNYENADDASEGNLTIYYSGEDPWGGTDQHSGWQFSFAGTVVTDKAEIYLSAGAEFKGNIFTNTRQLAMGGAGNQDCGLIYAPYANVLVGNGASSRAIVAQNFVADGGAKISYGDVDPETFPSGILKPADGVWDFTRSHWER